MTHGDSRGEFADLDVLSDERPPLRFCSEGDLPPIAAPLPAASQRLGAISEEPSPLEAPRWARQCALFFDLQAGGELAEASEEELGLPARFRFIPTRRSEWALNAAMRCTDPWRCELGGREREGPQARAKVAICSLLGDLWYLPEGEEEDARWRSALDLLAEAPSLATQQMVHELFASDPLSDDFLKGIITADFQGCRALLEQSGLPRAAEPSA